MEPLLAATMLATVGRLLVDRNWRVVSDVVRHMTRREADLVVVSPNGKTYVIEAKTGSSDAHFAELAQVEKLAAELSRSEGRGEVVPVLVNDTPFSSSMTEIADEVGVKVVAGTGNADSIAKSVVEKLADDAP
jgi:hypothetical protein